MVSAVDSKIHIVLSHAGIYRDVVEPLISSGATLHILDGRTSQENNRFEGKWELVFSMFSLRLLRLRNSWSINDRVLLIGWQAIPILAMIKLGLIKRPQKTLVMGCFVHGNIFRNIINKLLRVLKFDGLGFITFSKGESDNLINIVGVSPSAVYYHLWRQELGGKVTSDDVIDGEYVFSGGYSNRDYELLISAMGRTNTKLIIVASSRNKFNIMNDSDITIYRDLDESDFEKLLAQSKLVVLPLKNQGEACGQSVLLRVLRNEKPLIVTRHESIEDYLGIDYPGFVPVDDLYALRSMIQKALIDQRFRSELALRVSKASKLLDKKGSPAQEVLGFLLS